ncbi:MAG: hypothetical protein QOF78_4262 [Phycisphaerales bacterium]|jgi:hypothetical protein|nr:hypothetical protein [Phycisphaerales bacterium]
MTNKPLLIAITLLALIAAPALAQQKTSALINEELDKLFDAEINGTLPQAVKMIETKTGVPIKVTPQAYDLLPWGEQTTINAKIANQTLRKALDAITRKLGLMVELHDEAIEIKPLPALRRLGRRATVDELAVLDLLARTDLKLDAEHPTVKQILAAVDAKLEELKSPFAVENRAFADTIVNTPVAIARNATLLDALEAIPTATEATWYPWGDTLLVRPKADHVRELLGRTITRSWNGVDVSQVLAELANLSGTTFVIEPGAVQRIAGDSRNIRLVLENAPIQQALESIAGFTGLAWSVNEKGVYIWNAGNASAQTREPSIGLLTLDNGLQVVLRESQVPADLREYVKFKTTQHFEKMRQQMREENFKPPTTAPTTQRRDDL